MHEMREMGPGQLWAMRNVRIGVMHQTKQNETASVNSRPKKIAEIRLLVDVRTDIVEVVFREAVGFPPSSGTTIKPRCRQSSCGYFPEGVPTW